MIQPNPMSEYIAAYASGALSEGMSLLVGAHLTYSAERRREAAFYESISGALLDGEPSEPGPSLDATLALLDAPERARPAPLPFDPEMPLPVPVRQALAEAGDEIRWRFRLPGVHEHQIAGFDGETVSLMRVRPGRAMPHHTHDASEATLVFTGQMQDEGVVYARGDIALADHNDDHQPRVIGDETCYCLVVLGGAMRFTGPVSRALNIFSR
ncbi:MAG: cupin domain-containing protein [Pseudomonadota bacterium]